MSNSKDQCPITPRSDNQCIARLIKQLETIRAGLVALETTFGDHLATVNDAWRQSAANLLHYVALREHDIREIQVALAELGLSSLGRAESHVMSTLDSVLHVLTRLRGIGVDEHATVPATVDFQAGHRLLEAHTNALLGSAPKSRSVRIMVTMSTDAAEDYALMRDLVKHGMDCMRINCAHDGPDQWSAMIENLRRARRELSIPCRILMDLGGPKLRTGAFEPGAAVMKWRPHRNEIGEVIEPARIMLYPEGSSGGGGAEADAEVPLPELWLAEVRNGDQIELFDARGRKRMLRVTGSVGGARWAECTRTGYVIPGTVMRHHGPGVHKEARVGTMPKSAGQLHLHNGDSILLLRNEILGRGAVKNAEGHLISPATISCTLPEVFGHVKPGERIWFDDGKIAGIIREASADQLRVEIVNAGQDGTKLGSYKGINLPDSTLNLDALTAEDLENLKFVAKHSDLVGMSFVRRERDVESLLTHMHEADGDHLGMLLKIETRQGFERLPNLVLAAMRHHTAGVMIARGDLAVECGWERMAEVQEEILWICEAAHLPVIWATQVLESLAKHGMPSRAEITDAAMGERAECVMLNKGPHIVEAVSTLDDILRRMEAHQAKKSSRLRPLHLRAIHS